MPIIPLEQGSSSWLDYRLSKIMATDISIINETNDFKLPIELWEEKLKLRPPQAMNDAMRRGQLLEPEAREKACEAIGFDFIPCVFESDAYPWAAASLDGYCQENNIILEIKCPSLSTHINSFDNVIKSYYHDQMQWQLMSSRAKKCYYCSYCPEYKEKPVHIIEVFSIPDYQESLIAKGREFYHHLCTFTPPLPWKLQLATK